MNAFRIASYAFLGLAALVHLVAFVVETILFEHPKTLGTFGITNPVVGATAKPWALTQGFMHLFLAVGAVAGLALMATDHLVAGRSVALYASGMMLCSALVIFSVDVRMYRVALLLGIFPAAALGCLLAPVMTGA